MIARLAGLLFLLLLAACSDDRHVREWRPGDHDRSDEEGQVPAGDTDTAGTEDVATDVLFRQSCASCHAADGSGQTPMASQLHVKDLRTSTLAEEELVKVITRGRARMPAFGESLDPEAIRALAKKILTLRH